MNTQNNIPVNEKLNNLVNWLNYHNQSYVDRIKTINDSVKLFDYCQTNDIEFFDNLNDSSYYTMQETEKFKTEICQLLGYNIF